MKSSYKLLLGLAALILVIIATASVTSQLVLSKISAAKEEDNFSQNESSPPKPNPEVTPRKTPKVEPMPTKTLEEKSLEEFQCSQTIDLLDELKGFLDNPGDNWMFPGQLAPTFDDASKYFLELEENYNLSDDQIEAASETAALLSKVRKLSEKMDSEQPDVFISQSRPLLSSASRWFQDCASVEY